MAQPPDIRSGWGKGWREVGDGERLAKDGQKWLGGKVPYSHLFLSLLLPWVQYSNLALPWGSKGAFAWGGQDSRGQIGLCSWSILVSCLPPFSPSVTLMLHLCLLVSLSCPLLRSLKSLFYPLSSPKRQAVGMAGICVTV